MRQCPASHPSFDHTLQRDPQPAISVIVQRSRNPCAASPAIPAPAPFAIPQETFPLATCCGAYSQWPCWSSRHLSQNPMSLRSCCQAPCTAPHEKGLVQKHMISSSSALVKRALRVEQAEVTVDPALVARFRQAETCCGGVYQRAPRVELLGEGGTFREVADALAERATLTEQLDARRALVDATAAGFRLSEARYKGGVEQSPRPARRAAHALQCRTGTDRGAPFRSRESCGAVQGAWRRLAVTWGCKARCLDDHKGH